jgi:adenylate cyclase
LNLVSQPRLVLNGVEFNAAGGLLRGRQGEDIPLRPQSLAVLRHLAVNSGHVVSKDELMDVVWPGIAVTDNSLSQCISEIRKAIGDDRQVVLRTVARRGYRLVIETVPPELLPDEAPSGHETALASPLRQETVPAPEAAPPRGTGRRFALILVAAIAVIGAVAAALVWTSRREVPASLSIAVLPFADLSEAPEQAYLANGFTDDLTAELARVPGLFVVSRNAARAYAASELAPAAIAEELGVRYLLEGSVRRLGDDMRINAHLVDAATVGQIWAERFEGRFADVFGLQDQVTARIVDALQLKLVPG